MLAIVVHVAVFGLCFLAGVSSLLFLTFFDSFELVESGRGDDTDDTGATFSCIWAHELVMQGLWSKTPELALEQSGHPQLSKDCPSYFTRISWGHFTIVLVTMGRRVFFPLSTHF